MSALNEALDQIYGLNVGIIGTGTGRHERPHKPVMLLCALDLIEEGEALPSHIEWSSNLRERFFAKFAIVCGANDEPTPENPFYFLNNDGFWHALRLEQTREQLLGRKPLVRECDRSTVFARFSPEWQQLAANPQCRAILRDAIISRYFPMHREALLEGRQVIDPANQELGILRNASFRRALLEIYDYQCCACGLRVRIPEIGFTLVDAAHLVPFSVSRDDRPKNGLCLCKNHHWAMDQRLIAPSPEFRWQVSRRLDGRRSQGEFDLLALSGKSLLLPGDEAYRPSRDGLEWRASRLR